MTPHRRVLPEVLQLLSVHAKLCLNGNEYAKRQAARAGIGFTAAGASSSQRTAGAPERESGRDGS
jgi:hypothetical protein